MAITDLVVAECIPVANPGLRLLWQLGLLLKLLSGFMFTFQCCLVSCFMIYQWTALGLSKI